MKKIGPKISIYGKGKPIVAVVACLHGDEKVGKKILNSLSRKNIIKGTLITILGNPYAFKKGKRFIKQDLNRSFKGKKNGNIEEKIAYKIMEEVKKADYVIDIHFTTSNTKDFVIIRNKNPKVKTMIEVINPERVVLMTKKFGEASLINFCPGLSLEYANKNNYSKALGDVKKFLISLGLVRGRRVGNVRRKISYYKVCGTEKKVKGFVLKKEFENFKLVKRGNLLGLVKGKRILAKEDFYPVLFGEKAYKDFIGFKTTEENKL